MFKKLMTSGLIMCMLLIGAAMYSYPITCTKMRVMGPERETEVILLGDAHPIHAKN